MTKKDGDKCVATAKAKPCATATQERPIRERFFRPRVDILERPDEYALMADMPGSREEDIDLDLENGLLTIHAKVSPRQPEHREYILRQYAVGDYRRSFRVDETIDIEQISATYNDGVLTVHLPKAEARKPRRIAVSGG